MKNLFIIFQFLLLQNCYADEYFCEFKKKVDSISFVESSEIENSPSEENQEVLKLISEPVLLRMDKFEVEQTVRVNGVTSLIDYKIVKNDKNEITAVSKNDDFVLYFRYSDRKLVFSEFHDPSHVTNYFYFCN
ncbi:MAG: hypothetical protein CBC60_06450 [Betaproteobacteria bacterium TMED100]|nr:MAG: hypothetical protein CBC60_06450 [Betaproteobacteria bacterium TMED100]|tara:strand:- start:820 stop:1218 length:399 start_codon:yes stop_codon:yes gene_type:complete